MRVNHTKIYIAKSIVLGAMLFAPFVVFAVSSQLNINQIVNTEGVPEKEPEAISDSGGIIVSGVAVSLKISGIVISPTSNSVDIAWSTDKPLRSRVRWGVTKDYELGELVKFDDELRHAVSIGNLSPNTAYYLRVESEEDGIVTSWFAQTFITLPVSAPPPEEIKPPVRLAPPVLEEELIIPTIIPKEVPREEVAPPLEVEEKVRRRFIREVIDETVLRARDISQTYGGAIKGFFARITVVVKAFFIFAADRLKELFLKIR